MAQTGTVTSTTAARASRGRKYQVRGECRSESADGLHSYRVYSYRVNVDGAASSSGDVPCDGSLTVNSLGPVKTGAVVAIDLTPPRETTPGTAYVVIVPAP
ncbi:MAG: hypothetical protein WCF12_00035 [Propionicimonas sp.]